MLARTTFLDHIVTIFEELEIMKKATEFLSELYGHDVSGAVTLQELFVRYYVYDQKQASLGLTPDVVQIFKSNKQLKQNRDYPVHIDPHFATVVLSLPSENYKESGMKVKVYDASGKMSRRWRGCGRLTDFDEFGKEMEREKNVNEYTVGPFSILIFANPLPHSVTSLVAGERVSAIAFLGPEY